MGTKKGSLTYLPSSAAMLDDPAKSLYEMEQFVVLRLPLDVAESIREALDTENSRNPLEKRFYINFAPHQEQRRATIKFDKKQFHAKLMDLPCIVEILKTLDKKNFYKVADMSQILICKSDNENQSEDEKEMTDKKREKQFQIPHGITAPLKNVRKRRFRKTMKKKYVDAPELDKELKRLLRADLDAVRVKWEIVTEDQGNASDSQTAGGSFSQKTSSAQKPPEFSNLNLLEDAFFGGRVSSSSDEDGEGEGGALARQLLAGAANPGAGLMDSTSEINAEPAGSSREVKGEPQSAEEPLANNGDDDLRTDIFVCEAELDELVRERSALEMDIKGMENEALKDKMKEKIKQLEQDEKSKRQELNSMRSQMKSK